MGKCSMSQFRRLNDHLMVACQLQYQASDGFTVVDGYFNFTESDLIIKYRGICILTSRLYYWIIGKSRGIPFDYNSRKNLF
jgi:hypothetical protein